MTIRALLVSGELSAEGLRAGLRSPMLEVTHSVEGYPSNTQLASMVREVDVAFVSFQSLLHAIDCVRRIQERSPALPIIAIGVEMGAEALMQMLRAGVREVISYPSTPEAIEVALTNVARLLKNVRASALAPGALYCFLPGKAGVGASIVALNATAALARALSSRTLLCDCDLNAGISAFAMKLQATHSIRDAMDYAHKLDPELWNHFVCARPSIDVIGPGSLGGAELSDATALRRVIEFTRLQYPAVCIDFSGNLESWTIELLQQATQIFLVCTEEVPALHLSRLKARALRDLGMSEKVSILLNRADRRQTFSIGEIEKVLEFRVRFTFANDYKIVNEATVAGTEIDSSSELGQQFLAFGTSLVGGKLPGEPVKPRRKFLEFFSVVPQSVSTDTKVTS